MQESKKKICFVINSLNSGGAERVVSILANNLSELGRYDITIITKTTADSFYEISSKVNIIGLNFLNDKNSIANSKDRIVKFTKSVKKIKPHLLISFMVTTSCEAIIAAKITKTPIIIAERANPQVSAPSYFWKIFRRISFPFADYLVCQTKDSMAEYKWLKNKGSIPNPIKLGSRKLKEKQNLILAVGSLRAEKGFDMLILAFEKISKLSKHSDWKLIILGEGKERTNLEKIIYTRKLEQRVFLIGKVSNVIDYYSKAKLFVLSSRTEGMPNVLLEAMSYDLPCVAFDCQYGPREIFRNGEFGLLAEKNNISDLSQKILKLIENENLRETYARRAKLAMKRYSLKLVVEEWEKLITNYIK